MLSGAIIISAAAKAGMAVVLDSVITGLVGIIAALKVTRVMAVEECGCAMSEDAVLAMAKKFWSASARGVAWNFKWTAGPAILIACVASRKLIS